MKPRHIFLGIVTITDSFVVIAVEVYEQDDKQGVPEFSDQKSAGAKAVEVNPNVVDVAPIKPADLPPPPDVSKAARKSDDNEQPEVTHRGTVVDYGEENFKELKRDQQEGRDVHGEMDGRSETVWHQQHGEGAVHRRAYRR